MNILLAQDVIANGSSEGVPVSLHDMTFQATLKGDGTGSAKVAIEVSNDGLVYKTRFAATIVTKSASDPAAIFFDPISESWAYIRAVVTEFTLSTGTAGSLKLDVTAGIS